MPKEALRVLRMGTVDYGEALELQRGLAQARIHGEIEDTLLLLQHPPTITIGRAGKRQHLLAGEEVLQRQRIAWYEVERGGDITYHGPGQLVGYPILDLNDHGRDAHQYLRKIEEVLISTLEDFDIRAGRRAGLTGVWVGHRKIASIGVHLSRWVTWHGFALNVDMDLTPFQWIVPCGISGVEMVSMASVLGKAISPDEVAEHVTGHFSRVFPLMIRGSGLIA